MGKRISRFKLRNSDRSGFKEYEIDLIKDRSYLVAPDEYDTPPPSNKSLGGEGEVSGDPRANSQFNISGTAEVNVNPTYYITAAGGISPDLTQPFMLVTGSNTAVNISVDPQISRGKQNDILTLLCTDSAITLDHGTGLNMMGSVGFVMTSGASINFIYNSGNLAWNETSRFRP